MEKPFLLLIGPGEENVDFRVLNLLQVSSFEMANDKLTLKMPSGETYGFTDAATQAAILRRICDLCVLPDGSTAELPIQTVLNALSESAIKKQPGPMLKG